MARAKCHRSLDEGLDEGARSRGDHLLGSTEGQDLLESFGQTGHEHLDVGHRGGIDRDSDLSTCRCRTAR